MISENIIQEAVIYISKELKIQAQEAYEIILEEWELVVYLFETKGKYWYKYLLEEINFIYNIA